MKMLSPSCLRLALPLIAAIPLLTITVDVSADSHKRVDNYQSDTYGFRFRSNLRKWFAWPEYTDIYPYADLGVASASGFGAVVIPFCWQGDAPPEHAVISVVMDQFGEDYPSDFIHLDEPLEKKGATGRQLFGTERTDDAVNEYEFRIVMNQSCAYTLATWGDGSEKGLKKDFAKLWSDFDIQADATSIEGVYEVEVEKRNNAYYLFSLGLELYDSQSYRAAFNLLSQATELDTSATAYLSYSLRSLVDIEAYQEAYDWLQPRLAQYESDLTVQSWDAWLAYQTGDSEKALAVYSSLFAADYRDDEDFSVYMELLADAELWDELDRTFADYAAGGMTETLVLVKAQLLGRRGQYEEALVVLDEMEEGRPFNPEIAYERLDLLQDMGSPVEQLRVAELLIAKGYRSLRSFYYKGDAEFQMQSYLKARESFEAAKTYSPANTIVQEYLDAINNMLGEDDNSSISEAIAAVPLPAAIEKIRAKTDFGKTIEGYGAFHLFRAIGYQFDGGDTITQTTVRQTKILDDNGVREYSTLEFDFDPGYEQLYVNSVVVSDATGEKLAEGNPDSYYITHAENGFEASNEQTVHIPVPSLEHGVVVEAVVTKRVSVDSGDFPLEQIYFSSERPVDYNAVFVTGEIDLVRYESQGVDKPRKKDDTLTWETRSPVVYRWEPLQPYYDQILPWVYIGTVASDWGRAGSDYVAEIGDKLDISKTAAQAARLVDDDDSLEQKVSKLSAYVQENVHYEAIEFGRRAYIPKTARETLRDRYGDCKDHAVLLYSLLRAVDVPAELALVSLYQQVLPDLPSIDQFDHMIVSVQTEQGARFIDPTDKDLHLGELAPRMMAGNYALVLGDAPALTRIPNYPSGSLGLRVERTVGRDDDGHLLVREIGQFSQYQAAELRGQLRDIETSEMGAMMQRWVAHRYSDAEVTDYYVENIFNPANDLIVELEYRLPIDGDGSFEMPGFFESHYFEYERVAERRFPFEISFPLHLSSTTALSFGGANNLVIAAEKPSNGEAKFGRWSKQIDRNADGSGSNWTISIDYAADIERFRPDDYREFAEFHREFMKSLQQPLLLE